MSRAWPGQIPFLKGDIVLLEKVLNTSGKAINSLGLALLQLVEIASDGASHNTHVLERMLSSVQVVSSVQESFGRNATDVKAGSTEGGILLNANCFHTQLGCL